MPPFYVLQVVNGAAENAQTVDAVDAPTAATQYGSAYGLTDGIVVVVPQANVETFTLSSQMDLSVTPTANP
jgi:hypothetical protein